MAGGESLVLPPGCRDGKLALLIVSVLGEFMQGASAPPLAGWPLNCLPTHSPTPLDRLLRCSPTGGLLFGWPSLSGMLQDLGNYAEGCPAAAAAASAQGGAGGRGGSTRHCMQLVL